MNPTDELLDVHKEEVAKGRILHVVCRRRTEDFPDEPSVGLCGEPVLGYPPAPGMSECAACLGKWNDHIRVCIREWEWR